MGRILTGAAVLMLCVFLCGYGCKKNQEEPKGSIEQKVEKEDIKTFDEEMSEEVEAIPAPENELEEAEDPMLE